MRGDALGFARNDKALSRALGICQIFQARQNSGHNLPRMAVSLRAPLDGVGVGGEVGRVKDGPDRAGIGGMGTTTGTATFRGGKAGHYTPVVVNPPEKITE